ncbi:MAG: nuclear transport factor 2 family protein [Deltaproteobacteria bacterium]
MSGPVDDGVSAVLAANDAFYAAFSACDEPAMEGLWALQHPVSCTHPGRAVLASRDDVIASWQMIFRGTQRLRANAEGAAVCMSGAMAVVTCYERLCTQAGRVLGLLAATNVFVREGSVWRLVHHHASGMAPGPGDNDEDDSDDGDDDPSISEGEDPSGGHGGGLLN